VNKLTNPKKIKAGSVAAPPAGRNLLRFVIHLNIMTISEILPACQEKKHSRRGLRNARPTN